MKKALVLGIFIASSLLVHFTLIFRGSLPEVDPRGAQAEQQEEHSALEEVDRPEDGRWAVGLVLDPVTDGSRPAPPAAGTETGDAVEGEGDPDEATLETRAVPYQVRVIQTGFQTREEARSWLNERAGQLGPGEAVVIKLEETVQLQTPPILTIRAIQEEFHQLAQELQQLPQPPAPMELEEEQAPEAVLEEVDAQQREDQLLPEDFRLAQQEMLDQLRQQLNEDFEARLQEQQAAFDQTLAEQRTVSEALRDEIQQMRTENQQLVANVEQMRTENQQLTDQVAEQTQQLSELKELNAQAQTRYEEAQAEKRELSQQLTQVVASQQALSQQLEQERTQSERVIRALSDDVHALRDEVVAERQQKEQALERLEQQMVRQQQQEQALKDRLARAEAETEQLQERAAAAEQAIAAARRPVPEGSGLAPTTRRYQPVKEESELKVPQLVVSFDTVSRLLDVMDAWEMDLYAIFEDRDDYGQKEYGFVRLQPRPGVAPERWARQQVTSEAEIKRFSRYSLAWNAPEFATLERTIRSQYDIPQGRQLVIASLMPRERMGQIIQYQFEICRRAGHDPATVRATEGTFRADVGGSWPLYIERLHMAGGGNAVRVTQLN